MKNNFLKALGPGLIWAGASVGVSHLVQSTRAGANFGFELVWLVLLVNVLKYPFFEFAPRYAASTGENLLQGYARLGRWVLLLYLLLTLATMFTLQAAITSVTVGLLGNIWPGFLAPLPWTVLLLLLCVLILAVGRYGTLDRLMKIVIVVLSATTLVAVIAAAQKGFHPAPELSRHFRWELTDLAFVIALAGWMPTAIDVSVWHSVWTVAKIKQTGYTPKLKEALLDFNIGYVGTALLAIGFIALGALVMYGTGTGFPASGVAFANQLILLYTQSIGQWAYSIIALAALATMFSTTLTVMDAYPRVLTPTMELLFPAQSLSTRYWNIIWTAVLIGGTMLVLLYFTGQMRVLVDVATTLSFLTAPVLGYLNLKVVSSPAMPDTNKPGKFLRILSWVGILCLSAFAAAFLIWKLFLN